jgi:hypothetical protein
MPNKAVGVRQAQPALIVRRSASGCTVQGLSKRSELATDRKVPTVQPTYRLSTLLSHTLLVLSPTA